MTAFDHTSELSRKPRLWRAQGLASVAAGRLLHSSLHRGAIDVGHGPSGSDPAPTTMPASIGHKRRARRAKFGPAADCQTLVTKEGAIRSDAALAGGMTRLSRPMEIVGSPSPITPFTKPAMRNARVATARETGSIEGIGKQHRRFCPTSPKISPANAKPLKERGAGEDSARTPVYRRAIGAALELASFMRSRP